MLDDMGGSVHEFYSYEGSVALAEKLRTWPGGKLVIHITEMPIKCPVAPLEFAFLADAFFKGKGMRDKVEHHLRDARWTRPSPSPSPRRRSATRSRRRASPSCPTS